METLKKILKFAIISQVGEGSLEWINGTKNKQILKMAIMLFKDILETFVFDENRWDTTNWTNFRIYI